jgi:precorrin-8X/cobalt-precorrin-8 methylmutase
MARVIHPIERESYRILRSRIDLSHLPPLSRAVAERVCQDGQDVELGEGFRPSRG